MLALALTTRSETADRIADPLAERDIDVRHLPTTGRAIPLDGLPLSDTPGDPYEERQTDDPDHGADGEFDVGFVYPSRLTEGGVADVLLGVPWVNDREAVLTSRNKAGVIAALADAGVPVPETLFVSNPVSESALRTAFERFEPPVVVKPNSTTRGIGVTKAGDVDSLLGVCDYLGLLHDFPATGDKSFLLQEYVPDACDYRAMVLDGSYVGAVERRGTGWKHNVHRGAGAVGVDLPADLRGLAERVADVLAIPLLGVDLLVTSEGRAVVTETNARPTIDAATKYEEGFYDHLAALIRERAR